MSNKVLKGKVAVITGAGRGIGRAIALAYGKSGADICCIARNENELNETVASLHNVGANAAIPYLKKRKGGKIITLGPGLGHKGRAGKAPYCCSKAGL